MIRNHSIILLLFFFNGLLLLNAQNWQLITTKYNTADAFVAGNNVKDFGAKGDGVTDDTQAIQNALNALMFGKKHTDKGYNAGGIVFIPEGKYVIKKTITIPRGVTLRGEWKKPEKGKPIEGTILMSYVGKYSTALSPLLMLEAHCAVMDLAIWYPEQNPDKITAYSPAICMGSSADGFECQAMCARNITLVNAYEGIVCQRKYGGASPAVYNIYGTPLHTGVEIDQLSDVGRIEWINFSPDYWSGSGLPGSPAKGSAFEQYIYENATGILMMRNDWSYTCFVDVEGYNKGFHSSRSANTGVRGPNGHNYGMTFRNCKNGVYFSGIANSGIMFSRIKTENCENGFAVDGLPDQSSINLLHIDNCDIHATKNAIVSVVESKAYITLYKTKIREGAVDIRSGTFISTDADYTNEFPHIKIGPEARAIITGNRFTDPSQIVNNSLFECKIDHTPVNMPEMPEVNVANPDDYRQKPDRIAFYLATDAPFNAKGDAVTENTTAIQSALDKAAEDGGGIVYLPPGKYKVSGHLIIPTGVELKGSTDFRTCPGTPGSTLDVYTDRNNEEGTPFIRLREKSGIRGIVFNYPEQVSTDLPDNIGKYPYTIQGLGKDVYMVNIGFIAVYKGIDLFTNKCDNFYVDGVGGHIFKVGTKIGGNAENGVLANWQFNPIYYALGYSYKYGFWPNGIEDQRAKDACYSYATDELDFMIVDDCKNVTLYDNFGFGSQRGTVFTSSTGTGASGVALGQACDGGRRGFCFESVASEGFALINSQIVSIRKDVNDNTACYLETTASLDGKGPVSMFSCNYWGATNKAMILNGGTLNLYLSNFVNTGENGFAQISGNTKLNMVNSVIRPRNPLLSGKISGVSVQSSVADVQGFSTSNVALWKNNLSYALNLNANAMPNRTGWIASSSVNNNEAQLALDGNESTRWTTGKQTEHSDDWFMVDMQNSWKFNKIILNHAQSANDFPETFYVYVSENGTDWGDAIYSGNGIGGGVMIIGLEAQTARYIKIVLEAKEKTQHWSIHEFYALYDETQNDTSIPQVSQDQHDNKVWVKDGRLYLKDTTGTSIISIYSVSGQLMIPATDVYSSMDMNLKPGIYIATIRKGDQLHTEKIILNF